MIVEVKVRLKQRRDGSRSWTDVCVPPGSRRAETSAPKKQQKLEAMDAARLKAASADIQQLKAQVGLQRCSEQAWRPTPTPTPTPLLS